MIALRPLAAGDPALDRAVRLIAERCRPLRILLFGSRARGDAHEDSDYDIMLVVESPTSELELRAHEAAHEAGVSADVIVRSAARFEEDRDDVGTLVYAAEHEGRLLYGPPLVPRRVGEPDGTPRSVSAWLRRAPEPARALCRRAASR
ncbi:MAG TPA: nucleotidyltransferase domain-containing protein [Gemmatimonadaceae bacterium]|nr:nucleotidyltransferase domain-containing protein [Gemmatimonadaceae bacterium]